MTKDESYSNEGVELLERISSLHVVFHYNQSQVVLFGELVRYNPSVIVNLTIDDIKDQTKMITSMPVWVGF